MENYKEVATPTATNCIMDSNEVGKQVESTKYRRLNGSLLYLTTSRPYIHFNVCLCARFQSKSKESHYKAAKRILKYLKGTISVELWYPSDSKITLSGFQIFTMQDAKYIGKTQMEHVTYLAQA